MPIPPECQKWLDAGLGLPPPERPGRKPRGKAKAKAKARGRSKAKPGPKAKSKAKAKAKPRARAASSKACPKPKAKSKARVRGQYASEESKRSSAYHKARRQAKNQGLGDDAAKDLARRSFLVSVMHVLVHM